ncbi:uroporphyrinogen-III synthase [Paraflavisolibacter sp. H34]|uniref:uroporphyrinogen-III synthase n=1 Tax=Huijunlia imazamoxiresistens TaxID=3127457 RepID=UPI003015DD0A
MYQVLSTKKLSPLLVARAREKGIHIIEQEFISVRPLPLEAHKAEILSRLRPYTAIVFTSAHACEALTSFLNKAAVPGPLNGNVYCLSGKTRESLPSQLTAFVTDIADNAASLAQKIVARGEKEVLFFCGNQRRDELPHILKSAGIAVHEVVAYETTEVPSVALPDPDGVLFFSPSAVRSFFSANRLPAAAVCFAIGPTTAAAIGELTPNKVLTSEAPSQEMMLACVEFYFQNLNSLE